jgi:cell wall-associated NlpC family hydrolase
MSEPRQRHLPYTSPDGRIGRRCASGIPVVPSQTFTASVMRHTHVCHMMRKLVSRVIVSAGMALAPAVATAQAPDAPPAAAPTDSMMHVGPFAAFSASALSLRDSLVSMARAQLGRRYVLGGETPERGFDCSGLVKYLASALNLQLPRTAAQQASSGAPIPKDTASLRPGDLLLFGSGRRISHIGIYVGEGRFIHASSHAGRVVESRLLRAPARRIKPWRGVRRVVSDSVATPAAAGSTGTGPA